MAPATRAWYGVSRSNAKYPFLLHYCSDAERGLGARGMQQRHQLDRKQLARREPEQLGERQLEWGLQQRLPRQLGLRCRRQLGWDLELRQREQQWKRRRRRWRPRGSGGRRGA